MTSSINSISVGNGAITPALGQARQSSAEVNLPTQQKQDVSSSKLDAVVQPSISGLSKALDGLNKTLEVLPTHLRFRLHEDTNRYYVEIIDTLEDTVIREVPPKRFLDMVADMYQFFGIVVDVKR